MTKILVEVQNFKLSSSGIEVLKNRGFIESKEKIKVIRFDMKLDFKNKVQFKKVLSLYEKADYIEDVSDYFVIKLNEEGLIENISIQKNEEVKQYRKEFFKGV